MPQTLYKNNVAGQLNAGIGPTDTAVLLTAGGGAAFPTPGAGQYFYATLIHATTFVIEIVKVTARVGDTLTIARAFDNTAATSFTAGSVIEMRLCAIMLEELDLRSKLGNPNGVATLDAAGKLIVAQVPDLSTSYIAVGQKAAASGVCDLDAATKVPVARLPDLSTTYIAVGQKAAANGVATLDGTGKIPDAQHSSNIPLKNAAVAFTSTLSAVGISSGADLRTQTAGALTKGRLYFGDQNTDYLDWDDTKFTLSQNLSITGTSTATNHISTSDRRLKAGLRRREPAMYLADQLELYDWLWKNTGEPGTGPIAQDVRKIASQHVHKTSDNHLGVDKGGLALEAVIGLARRVRALEGFSDATQPATDRKRARVPRARAAHR